MNTDLFDFDLPDHAIAVRPVTPRDSAKLLEVKSGALSDHRVTDLPQLLEPGDVLVLNETRVLRAALSALRPARAHGGGGDVNVDVNLLLDEGAGRWRAFVRPAKRVRTGDVLMFSSNLTAKVYEKGEAGEIGLDFNVSGDTSPDERDILDYQTIYAKNSGSVAAPTAGLHFTPALFEALKLRKVQVEYLTLHVGAGTFLPVKSETTTDHKMHSESYEISDVTAQRIMQAKSEGRRIIAVGTTTLRALESASQSGALTQLSGETQIFITPGYTFKVVDGLMTNFHLPKSTLFMLVSALAGLKTMKAAYAYAIANAYRFYSYGDSSLLWKHQCGEI